MVSITVLLTCHNRKSKTEECIHSIYDSDYAIRFIVTDDGSTDGTAEMLNSLKNQYDITVLQGNGSLYWCGGMRAAIEYAQSQTVKTDYYVLMNDDVKFIKGVLKRAIDRSIACHHSVIAGATCDLAGHLTYGAVRYRKHTIDYQTVTINDTDRCDTFNCNFVLLPCRIFEEAGNFDSYYRHAMADFDYGFQIGRLGYHIYGSGEYVGVCERNSTKGTWKDVSLSGIERIKKKESPKGLPAKEWFYFLHKNFGFGKALWHSITPYLRILAGR